MFPSASTLVFNTFACDNAVGDGRSYLRADYSISCESTKHGFFKGYAMIMILVRAGVSSYGSRFLYVVCSQIHAECRRSQRTIFEVELRFDCFTPARSAETSPTFDVVLAP